MSVSKPPRSKPSLEWARAVVPGSFLTRRFMRQIRLSAVACRNGLYLAYEKALAYLVPGKRLRILISQQPQWQDTIRQGFNRSRHEVVFGPIVARSFTEFDVVVPLGIPELMQARQWPELLSRNPIPIPSEESILLCDDKFKFGQALGGRGFGYYIPKMTLGRGLEPPYILKKRIGCWGQECRVIRDRHEEWCAQDQINDPAFYCQEIVRGTHEFATHILFAGGRIVKSLNIMYAFENDIPIKGQNPPLYLVIHRCPHLGLFTKVLRSIGFQGLCCVNYKVVGRRPYIFEINPRFGGSLNPYFFSFMRHLNLA